MIKKILIIFFISGTALFGQYNLDYFINKALENSPVLQDYNYQTQIANLQIKLDEAQNSAFLVYLSGNFLFAPYFNNNGRFVTTNPSPQAIGYDVGITNGGEYSALINVEKNIFNGSLLSALKQQSLIKKKDYDNKLTAEKHSLKKEVTDQYINARQYYDLYNLSKEINNNLKNQLKVTENLVTKGLTTLHDYLLLKVEYKSQKINLDENWRNYKNGLLRLYSLCGIKDTEIVQIDSVDIGLTEAPVSSQFLHQYKIDSLRIASQQEVFDTKYLPQIKIFANAGLNAIELDNFQRKFGISAGINFSLPLLDGGQSDIKRQQNLIAQKTIENYKDSAKKNLYIQRRDALMKIKSLKKSIQDFEGQINDYQKVLNLSLNELQRGNLSMINYLTEIKNYIELKKNKISTEINYQLEKANYNYWSW